MVAGAGTGARGAAGTRTGAVAGVGIVAAPRHLVLPQLTLQPRHKLVVGVDHVRFVTL